MFKNFIVDYFTLTQENRQNLNTWPEWLFEAWNKSHDEYGAAYPSEFPDSEGTDPIMINTHEGPVMVNFGDTIFYLEEYGIILIDK